eukprot:CAMPEP_0185025988 /NCGR_PEP_ID=MMETSP1103-20130426/9498_1 /TAXON_ID=36769 /ORGANISM="Paraphysomonas bandaiensis, Strain Caron Lab Isolate" /LENGTH=1059 /DNA_ID=CAMNT_0027559395 /DNA_START=120 /DNA_END=3296 /DNA_ORIENTATION=+
MTETRQWSPDPSALEQVALMLNALRDPTRGDHQNALAALQSDTANPTFVLHLLEIFSQGGKYDGLSTDIRQLAGLIVKNYVFPHFGELPANVFQVVKEEILRALVDPLHKIRSTAGILVGRICDAFSIDNWADMIESLLNMLQSDDPVRIDGALHATQRMCEDACEKLNMDTVRRPLEFIVPVLLKLLNSNETTFRLKALESLNSLIFLIPAAERDGVQDEATDRDTRRASGSTPCALITHMDAFLSHLAALASDFSAPVRRAVCQAIVLLTSFQLAMLAPLMLDICTFMIRAVMDQEEAVAMEACEFWWVLVESIDGCNFLIDQHMTATGAASHTPNNSPVGGPSLSISSADNANSILAALIPNLISRLGLTAAQIEFDRTEEEAEDSGEKEINFKPIHYNTRSSRSDEEGEEGGDGGGGSMLWTLRKESARVLDCISCAVPTDITLALALPVLQQNLSSGDVWVVEAGVLGLGALSRGCMDEMAPFLPSILPFLLASISDRMGGTECPPELRCVSAWVIGRYSYFWFDCSDEEQTFARVETQKEILSCLLTAMVQKITKLQAAVCAALCAIFESSACPVPSRAGEESINILDVCLPDILKHIEQAFSFYGVKNTLLLCDTLATLCDSMGPFTLQSREGDDPSKSYSALFLPALLQKFFMALGSSQLTGMSQSIEAGSFVLNPYVFPIMECITSVAPAVGRDIAPYAAEITQTCLRLIGVVIGAYQEQAAREQRGDSTSLELPNKDYIMCSLDVLSGVTEALEGSFAPVALGSRPAAGENSEAQEVMIQQLLLCLCDESSADVRQSAFSLLGDLVSKGECVSVFCTPTSISLPSPPTRSDTGVNLAIHPSDIPPGVAYIVQVCLVHMEPRAAVQWPLVANNAVWSLGEICLALGQACAQIGPILAKHVALLLVQTVSPASSLAGAGVVWEDGAPVALKQNLAIALGRICMTCAREVGSEVGSPVMSPDCLHSWCRALKLVQYSSERDQAFSGLVAVLNVSPHVLLEDTVAIEQFVLACASWDRLPGVPDVARGLRDILLAVRAHGGDTGASGAPGAQW